MYRRQFIGGVGAGSATALAGCADLLLHSVEGRPDPHINSELLDEMGFVKIDEESVSDTETIETSGISQEVEIEGITHIYEDEGLRHQVRDDTLGELNASVRTLFTTKLAIDPNTSNIPGVGESTLLNTVEPEIEDSFHTQLESMGVQDLERESESTLSVDTGEDARLYRYSGRYPYDDIEFPLSDGAAVTIPADDVAIRAMYALWVHDGFVLVAGGGFPTEDVVETIDSDVTEALSVTVDIDLALADDSHEDDLKTLMAATS